jgi:hypothetical protein
MRLRSPLQVLLLSAAALVGACDKHDLATATSAPGGSSVSIIGLDPVEEQPLQPGSKVRVACRVAYTLTGDKSGQLALIAQSHSGDLLASTFVPITPATGNQELSVEFVVPKGTPEIDIFVPLSAGTQGATTTVSHRAYRVVAK